MGALSNHFDELEARHKAEVDKLEMKIIDLTTELSMIRERYDSLCGTACKDSNGKRSVDEHSAFLRGYARDKGFWE
jgi:hypothetical protein